MFMLSKFILKGGNWYTKYVKKTFYQNKLVDNPINYVVNIHLFLICRPIF